MWRWVVGGCEAGVTVALNLWFWFFSSLLQSLIVDEFVVWQKLWVKNLDEVGEYFIGMIDAAFQHVVSAV